MGSFVGAGQGQAVGIDLWSPDWWSAIGQNGAMIIAILTALWAIKVGRRDRGDRLADQADREAAQARQVLASQGSVETQAGHVKAMVVTNHSTEILTEVEAVDVWAPELPRGVRVQWWGSPLSRPNYIAVLAAGEQFHAPFQFVWPDGQIASGSDWDADHPPVPPIRFWTMTVRYTDARGFRWERRGGDQPVRQIDPAPPGPARRAQRWMWRQLRRAAAWTRGRAGSAARWVSAKPWGRRAVGWFWKRSGA